MIKKDPKYSCLIKNLPVETEKIQANINNISFFI